eukprot:gene8171-12631_t
MIQHLHNFGESFHSRPDSISLEEKLEDLEDTGEPEVIGENYETKLSKASQKELKEIGYPSDSIEVSREIRPQNNPKIVPDIPKNSPEYFTEVFNFLKQSNIKVDRKYKEYKKTEIEETEYELQSYETDLTPKEIQKAVQLDPDVPVDLEFLTQKQSSRQQFLHSNMKGRVFKFQHMKDRSIEYEYNGAEAKVCKREDKKSKIDLSIGEPFTVEIRKFETSLASKLGAQPEPLFLSMCLYDAQSKQPVSETFHLDFNSVGNYKQLGVLDLESLDPIFSLKGCMFSLENRNPNVYLLIKVLKILQGDEESASDPYVKYEKIKDISKLESHYKDYLPRLRFTRQTIGFTALPLFDNSGDIYEYNGVPYKEFRRCKTFITDAQIVSMFTPDGTQSLKKFKSFPASITVDIKELSSYDGFEEGPKDTIVMEKKKPFKLIKEFPLIPKLAFKEIYENILYVYPENVNLSGLNYQSSLSRNITIKVQFKDNDDDIKGKGLKAFYGKNSHDSYLMESQYTQVTYHNRHPDFVDEFKIKLPTTITRTHHILFTFYHVTCKPTKNSKDASVLGWAYKTLFNDGSGGLLNGPTKLTFVTKFTNEKGYLSSPPADSLDKKPFNVSFRSFSTLYPSDKHLANFYQKFQFIQETAKENIVEAVNMLGSSINSISQVPEQIIVENLPVVANQLIRIICSPYEKVRRKAFMGLIHVFDVTNQMENRSNERNKMLTDYVNNLFSNGQDKTPFLSLISEYNETIKESQSQQNRSSSDSRKYLSISWVIFDLIIKSISLYLESNKKLNSLVRLETLPNEFYDILEDLVSTISYEAAYQSGPLQVLAKDLNANFSLFLRDLLNVADRGIILSEMQSYIHKLSAQKKKHVAVLHEMKITNLQILSEYEHLFQISYPLFSDTPTTENDLIHETNVAGIVLTFAIDDLTNQERSIRERSYDLLSSMMKKFEYDDNFKKQEDRGKVATMFFPFILRLIKIFEKFKTRSHHKYLQYKTLVDAQEEQLSNCVMRINHIDPNNDTENQLPKLRDEEKVLKKNNADIKSQLEEEGKRVKLEVQNVLICFLFIIKNVPKPFLKKWWKKEASSAIVTFLQILKFTIESFKYPGKETLTMITSLGGSGTLSKNQLNESKSQIEDLMKQMENRTRSGTTGTGTGKIGRNFNINRNKNQSLTRNDISQSAIQNEQDLLAAMRWEGNLNTEIELTCVDILTEFSLDFADELFEVSTGNSATSGKDIIEIMFDIISYLLGPNHSEKGLIASLNFVHVFLESYGAIVFSNDTARPYSEILCTQLFKLCISKLPSTRSFATFELYNLLKGNFKESGNFAKTKSQTTTALSKLAQGNVETEDIQFIRSALSAIETYAKKDKEVETMKSKTQSPATRIYKKTTTNDNFPKQVAIHVERLSRTLLDTVKIKELQQSQADKEMMAELYLSIAMGYKHSPELSVTWMENLSEHHKKNKRWAEAAQCQVYNAAVSFQFMKLNKAKFVQNLDYNELVKLLPMLKNETFEELKSLFAETEQVVVAGAFTRVGFITIIKNAIEYFDFAEMYESSITLYKILLSIYEVSEDFLHLKSIHTDIAGCYGHLIKTKTKKRLLGSYYKVVYLGNIFGKDLNGVEYLLKMPKITRLAEVMDHLQKYYIFKFGKDKVKIIGEKPIDEFKNQDDIAYIQIIGVEPMYEKSAIYVDKFFVEIPFTKTGKAQSSNLSDQYKKKVILKVDKPFPALLTRRKVTSRQEIITTPIENATELVEKVTLALKTAISQDPPNLNSLQMVMSGALIPQVHEGVPQIIQTFITAEGASKLYKKEHVQKLKECLSVFLDLANKSVQYNGKHVKEEHKPLQIQFEKGLKTLEELFSKTLK